MRQEVNVSSLVEELNKLPKSFINRLLPLELFAKYESVLAKFPVGTKLSVDRSDGTAEFEKLPSEFNEGWWDVCLASFNYDHMKLTDSDIIVYFAVNDGSGTPVAKLI